MTQVVADNANIKRKVMDASITSATEGMNSLMSEELSLEAAEAGKFRAKTTTKTATEAPPKYVSSASTCAASVGSNKSLTNDFGLKSAQDLNAIFPILVEESVDELEEEMTTRSSLRNNSTRASGVHALDEDDDDPKLAKEETKAVCHLRILLLVFLTVAALGVGLAVYFYTTGLERHNFEQSFHDQAAKVLDAMGGTLDMTLGAVDSHVIGLVSFARATQMEWPFVALPDHAVRLAKIRTLSKAVSINQYIYVEDQETRLKWENYSIHHDGWVQGSLDVQKHDRNYHGALYDDYYPSPALYGDDGHNVSYDIEGPFFPAWQNYPVIPVWPPYNWDGSTYQEMMESLPELLSMHAVLTAITNIPNDPDDPEEVARAQGNSEWAAMYVGSNENPNEPYSDLLYPIMDCAADVVSMTMDHTHSHLDGHDHVHHTPHTCNLVGVLALTFYWRDLMRDILSSGSKGMVAVVESSCSNNVRQTFTSLIDGPAVSYLGPKDLHDPKYEYLRKGTFLHSLEDFSMRDRDYTGLPIGNDTCSYRLNLYPSQEMEDQYTTKNPVLFTVVAILIFGFTSALFVAYDWYVERRQSLVLKTAVQSTANVCILEEKVRERTKKLEASNQQLAEANREIMHASARQLQHFACMSHEIRTPLNCIIGLSSLMQQESQLNKKDEESIRMIVMSGDLLLRVVNDVLDYSKLEAGKVVVEVQRCQLQDALNAVVRSIETSALSKKVTVETYYDTSVGDTLETDSRRLQQILYNLLGNAIKFSHEGGVVELRVEHFRRIAETAEVCMVKCKGNDGGEQFLRFVVKDYGKGIEKENFAKIFQPFLQASTETERIYGGSGLGLAITAKLVKALGGSISVNSEVGKWTEMFVDFPFGEHKTPVADIAGLSKRLQDATVLLIGSSNDRNVTATRSILQQYDVDHKVFHDLKELGSSRQSNNSSFDPNRTFVTVIQEDLYKKEPYQKGTNGLKSVLLAYGHKYGVQEAKGHFRSLTGVLPSVLAASLADHLAAATRESAATASEGASATASSSEKAYQHYRVLIAEDNTVNQKVASRILTKLGITNVVIVDNGQKAVDREAAEDFDVILMDMQMPVMDGIDATRLIMQRQKQLGRNERESTKVIFVTAHALDHFREKCQEAGGSGFLSKPFRLKDVEECFQKVQEVMEGKRSSCW